MLDVSVDVGILCLVVAGTNEDVSDDVFAGCAGVFSVPGDETVDVVDCTDVPGAFSVTWSLELNVADGERDRGVAVDCCWFKDVSRGVIGTFVEPEAAVMSESAGVDDSAVGSFVANTDVLSEATTVSVRVYAVNVVDFGTDTGRFAFVL